MEEYQLKPETKEGNNNDKNLSKDIICNICKEICFIDIHNYTFKLYGCKNNHVTKNILLPNFEDTQKIKHEEHYHHEHSKDNYSCDKHNGEQFTKYCKNHNKNICIQCENEHKKCTTIYFGDILPNKDQLDCKKLKEYINKLKNEINEIINNLKYVMDNLEIYYNISKNIINNFNNSNKRNYQILENTNQFIKFNSIIINDIEKAINSEIFEKYKKIINIYDHIKGIKYSNYIIAEIEIQEEQIDQDIKIINNIIKEDEEEEYLHLFTKYLINNQINSSNIEIEIDGNIIPFSQNYKFKEKGIHILKYYINIKLSNISGIFKDCKDIVKIDMTNFNNENIIDMNSMFYGCESLNEVNLSNIKTALVKDISCIFKNCSSLEKVDLSNFKTENVEDMSYMFYGCKSLKNIDLSNFNTINVKNLRKIFKGCRALKILDLSNFNTENVKDMSDMFIGCKSLNFEQIKTNDKRIIKEFESCKIF